MSYLYVTEQGAMLSFNANRFEVKHKNGLLHSIPAETLEMIELFGNIHMTTRCMQECLKRGINVVFFSSYGSYYGRLISTNHVNVRRQRLQADIGKNMAFLLRLDKRMVSAKVHNQIVVLQRYSQACRSRVVEELKTMKIMEKKIHNCEHSIDELMGFEGFAARAYFKGIGKIIDPDFRFNKRTRIPPRDPFNSMISLGYSILLNEIYGKIEGKGLNPYFGVLHQDREKHPTLASDLMEEWRAVLIDTTVMGMISRGMALIDDFTVDQEHEGVFLSEDLFKKYVRRLEERFNESTSYLDYVPYSVSFRRAMDLQIQQLIKAFESEDPGLYHPIRIR